MKTLSERQLVVLRGIALGCTRKQIAVELKISCKTVEYHALELMTKLGLSDVARLTHWAIRYNIVKLGEPL